jgi:predicted P-loop ATPase
MAKAKITLTEVANRKQELTTRNDKPQAPIGTSLHPAEILAEWLNSKYEFKLNLLSYELELYDRNTSKALVWDDITRNKLLVEVLLQRFDFKTPDGLVDKVIFGLCTKPYNPLKDYFDSLVWDGKDHISELAKTVIITHNQMAGVWLSFLTKWLVATYAQATNQGLNHTCLVLSGAQGRGKTTWLNNLCPNANTMLYIGHIDPALTNNTTANILAEKFIANIDDQLEKIISKDFNALKSIITTPQVSNRKAYAKLAPTRQRVCSFVASVNNAEFLADTSNRRYLVFPIDDIRLDTLKGVNVSQVWAQAKSLFESGYKYYFDKEGIEQLDTLNAEFRATTVEEELVTKYLFVPTIPSEEEFMMQTEILDLLQSKIDYKLNSSRLSTALIACGFKKKDARINGKPRKVYIVARAVDTDIDSIVRKTIANSTTTETTDTIDDDILPF